MSITLYIKSTILASGSTIPEVVEQQLQAEITRSDDRITITYQEGDNTERSNVQIVAYIDQMVISREGPISYRQVYQPNIDTICQMTMPIGMVEMKVKTSYYQFQPNNQIDCRFVLEQGDAILGEYQLDIQWKL